MRDLKRGCLENELVCAWKRYVASEKSVVPGRDGRGRQGQPTRIRPTTRVWAAIPTRRLVAISNVFITGSYWRRITLAVRSIMVRCTRSRYSIVSSQVRFG
jgi:hypothetical protein